MANKIDIALNVTGNAAKGVDSVIGSFTEFASMLSIAERGLGAVSDVFDNVIGATVEYAEEVRDLSRITGMAAEESSAFIQVADDLKVSYEAITRSAQYMAQEGIVPTIDKMAELSDEYNNFTDKNEQAAWAYDTFGRNYMEITRMLEAGGETLRQMAADQPEGLILSQKDLDSAREYEIAIDGLQDTWSALKLSAGKLVLPIVVEGLEKSLSAIDTIMTRWHDAIYVQWKDGALEIGYKDVLEMANLMRSVTPTIDAQTRAYTEQARQAEDVQQGIDNLTRGYTAQAEALGTLENDQEVQKQAYEDLKDAVYGLDGQERLYHDGLLDQIALHTQAAVTIEQHRSAAERAAKSIGEDLAGAYKTLEDAQLSWHQKVGEDAASALENMKLSADKLKEGLGAIDEVMGTNTLARAEYEEKMVAINEEFAKTGDVDAYKASLTLLADEFGTKLSEDVKKATEAVQDLQTQLDSLPKEVTIPIKIDVQYPHGGIPSEVSGGGTGGGAGGGTSGGESIPTGGKTPDFGGIIINNFSDTGAAVAIAQAYARAAQNTRTNTRMA